MSKNFIPLSVPNFQGNELKYVSEAINSEWVSTGGAFIDQFEDKISEYVGSIGAVSCQSGTSGLHLALTVCGVEANDEVIVPTVTFIAAVNPVRYIGAEPVFIDCDDSLAIDPAKVNKFIEEQCIFKDGVLINKHTNKFVKALIVVHVFGNMADMVSLMKIAKKYNLKVVEDATEALGTYYTEGEYKDQFAGTIGDIGVYSFNGNKIITTGGGGMIVSQNGNLLKRAKHLSTQAKSDGLYYTHDEVGYNYRMTNLQAALGLAQLENLENFITVKEQNYLLYKKLLKGINGLELINFRSDIRPNYWFYSLMISENYPLDRDQLIKYLNQNNIQVRPIWGLISDQLPYKNNQEYYIEKARFYIDNVINIPCSSNLKPSDVEYVVKQLENPKI